MKTRITEMLGIKYPIILPGMSFISVPKLVAAVSNAGGLGILATAPLGAKELRAALGQIRNMTGQPYGVNIALLLPNAMENLKVALQEKVPVINIALGKGDRVAKAAHEYGGRVIATVVNTRHAISAQNSGCDAVISVGHEAAAHGDLLTTFTLIPMLANKIKIPIIAAGGIGDGRGLVAAMALGADGVAMGTRLMMTKESPLHSGYKELALKKGAEDTLFSDRFDGLPCRILDTEGGKRAVKRGFSPIQAFFSSKDIAAKINSSHFTVTLDVMKKGYGNARQLAYMANAYKAFYEAIYTGDVDDGVLPAGQVIGLIEDEPSVAELFSRILREAGRTWKGVGENLG